jgi:hypothetical protein
MILKLLELALRVAVHLNGTALNRGLISKSVADDQYSRLQAEIELVAKARRARQSVDTNRVRDPDKYKRD